MDQQVAPFHKLDAHLLREEGVLEISRVGNSRCQKDGRGVLPVGAILRRQAAQRCQKRLRIMIHRPDAVIPEHGRKHALQHLAVRQHVRNAAGHAQVVLQDRKTPIRQAHQVRPANARVNVPGHVQTAHFPPEMPATVNQFSRHKSFGKNPPFVINIPQEKVQRRQPLR